MNATKLLLTLFGLSLVPASTFAKPVRWTLTNVQFDDGGTATGSFIYDAEKDDERDVNITTQGGSVRPGATYITVIGNKNLKSTGLFLTSWGDNQTGLPGLALFYTSALTDNGGTVLIRAPESLEVTCASTACNGFTTPQRHVISGSLEGTSAVGCPSSPPEGLVGDRPCREAHKDNYTSIAAAPYGGFWVQLDKGIDNGASPSGRTLTVGGAPQFENVAEAGTIAAIPGQNGYFVVGTRGHIYSRGTAPELCGGELGNCSVYHYYSQGGEISAVAATPDGQGLWAVTSDGEVFTAGTAQYFGKHDNENAGLAESIVPTTSGKGYWILLGDGGVFSFGDAQFHGSTGGKRPGGKRATGLAPSMDLNGNITGYWMVASDGGVFSFNAPFLGSTGGNNGGHEVTGITTLPDGHQYAWVNSQGTVTVSQGQTFNKVVFTSVYNGALITAPSGNVPGADLTVAGPYGNSPSQEWSLMPTPTSQAMRLVNAQNGLCANVTENESGDRYLIQYPCASVPQPNESFRLLYNGGQVQINEPSVAGVVVYTPPATLGVYSPDPNDAGFTQRGTWTLSQGK